MKKTLLIALTMFIALGITSCSKGKNEIKVMSFNILVSHNDESNNWGERKVASLNMLNEEKPTIFGLQEALPPHLEYLKEQLPQYASYGIARDDGKTEGEYMTIYYLKDEVELLDCGTFWLSETPETPAMGWDAA